MKLWLHWHVDNSSKVGCIYRFWAFVQHSVSFLMIWALNLGLYIGPTYSVFGIQTPNPHSCPYWQNNLGLWLRHCVYWLQHRLLTTLGKVCVCVKNRRYYFCHINDLAHEVVAGTSTTRPNFGVERFQQVFSYTVRQSFCQTSLTNRRSVGAVATGLRSRAECEAHPTL